MMQTTKKALDDNLIHIRSHVDRRSGLDRRCTYNLDYFAAGNPERRIYRTDRRNPTERRKSWFRISTWHSIPR